MLADEYEGLINFGEMCVDDYLRTYSVFTSSLKLLPLSVIREREKVSRLMQEMMSEMNRVHKDKKRKLVNLSKRSLKTLVKMQKR